MDNQEIDANQWVERYGDIMYRYTLVRVKDQGAGRTTGVASATDSFDRSAMPREALGCKGYRGVGNSASTLGQLCVNCRTRHSL